MKNHSNKCKTVRFPVIDKKIDEDRFPKVKTPNKEKSKEKKQQTIEKKRKAGRDQKEESVKKRKDIQEHLLAKNSINEVVNTGKKTEGETDEDKQMRYFEPYDPKWVRELFLKFGQKINQDHKENFGLD